MSEQQKCPVGFSLFLNDRYAPCVGSLKKFDEVIKARIAAVADESRDFPADEFHAAVKDYIDSLRSHGYGYSSLKTAGHALNVLYLFLDIHSLGYHPEIASAWFSGAMPLLPKNWKHWRRLVYLFAEYCENGDVIPSGKYTYGPTSYDALPEWCRSGIEGFLDLLEREFHDVSTLRTYRYPCIRLCRYLADHNYSGFGSIDADTLQQFCLQDQHMTFKGKSSYFGVIRRFIIFLEDTGQITNEHLHLCIDSGCAPGENVVDILTEDQCKRIEQYRDCADSPIALRRIAMVMTGIRMGLRASDVINLKLADIDWHSRSISIIQEKTKTSLTLPMPVPVGNAIYRYIKEGRPQTCSDYVFIRHIPVASLGSDTAYFTMMGRDDIKLRFFKDFVKMMRKRHPSFGNCCYIDSTPLPNDISDNPFNALCSHGIGSVGIQTRMILVLDEETGLPIWFQTIAGNVLDLSTINSVRDNLKEQLDIDIYHMVLDAGYVTKDLITQYHLDSDPVLDDNAEEHQRLFIGKMPAKKGFPYKTLYHQVQKLIPNAKYEFIRGSHSYFGVRKTIEIFGKREYAYIYVDKDNALHLGRKWRLENEELYLGITDKEKNWYSVKSGYFILLSNEDTAPAALLDEYFGRTRIETVFKTAKEYLHLLPLSKWTIDTVSGKFLSDCISTIIYLMLQKKLDGSKISMTRLLGQTQSLMCMKTRDGVIRVETANKQARAVFKALGIQVPSNFRLDDYCKNTLSIDLRPT